MGDLTRNPYTGMEMAKENTGNGESIPVENLINRTQPGWEEFTPVDTMSDPNSKLEKFHESLNNPSPDGYSPNMPRRVSVEEIMNMDQKDWKVKESETDILKNNPVAQINNKTQGYDYGTKKVEFEHDDLSLNGDELINNLTSVLNL